jgi:basic membrane protein A
MQRTRILSVITVSAAALLALSACAAPPGGGGAGDSKTAALLIPGTTGDGGFFDQSSQGTKEGAVAAGWKAQIVEAGYDPTKWQPALDDLSNGTDNPIITGTYAMTELVEQEAAQHPEKNFVLFDSAIDESKCGNCKNVYSITYRYDETGFLAGALAGLLEKTKGVEKVKGTGTVGVVGGQNIPVIEDYIRGFKAGVAAVAPDVKVLSAFAGSFSDPVQGKAVAEDMIAQGAEILFTAAGQTDKGVFEGAAAHEIWALGNARAQADAPKIGGVETILTSSDTNIASSMKEVVTAAAANKLPVGTVKSYGVKDGAVDIVESATYKRVVPAEIQQKLKELTANVATGKYESVIGGK